MIGGFGRRGLVLGEGEVVFFFLQEVQPQQRVQAVQARQQVIDLVELDRACRLRQTDMRADAIGEALDLSVGAAHGGGGLTTAQGASQRRIELGFLRVFVGQDPVGQQGVRGDQRLLTPQRRGR